ncbi:MAG: phytanoyl-CoA dioxygenase, partial [Flavobacteriales bacterium]
ESETSQICELISRKEVIGASVMKSKNLFAIRQVLIELPELKQLILNKKLKSLISELRGESQLFISKAIYFDKPENSNWFVPFHQDLTIHVTERTDTEGFKNWTNKRGQIGVQPPNE